MWNLAGREFKTRMLLGTSRYPSAECLQNAILGAEVQIVTVSLRREMGGNGRAFWDLIRSMNLAVLPNTAGCRSAREAITTAQMAREVFGTHWIKLETVGDDYTLQPDPFAGVEAAQILIADGFGVFP